ncbi:DUF6714 family protein [Flavobacterium gilvum]|uniref:Uncharacterized protein n=1 Tax=Flavobacterium gilvum TaxID=1492737 RepID=A0AAC9I546_9FLAO|nr:DUF6714 family protein [Flavobacterium gilvum]AOW09855.1 hypothetical protein EM308_10245 [Flavobacterium gilvum]KFC58048.1 hypothetical protein FEM08_31160 [Flavobacterium gilvum]
MTKDELINEIQIAFKDVILEDGIGLWEGQGIDDYADNKTILQLRKKDERNNWQNIAYQDLADCASSLSFFDAKGMRFHLPKFIMFDILEEELRIKQNLFSPDVLFTLSYNLDEEYQQNRFSLLNNPQIQSIIHYLKYKQQEIIQEYQEYAIECNTSIEAIYEDTKYIELNITIEKWKQNFFE